MKIIAILLSLLLLGSTMVEAGSLAELTLGELNGPKIDESFRDGIITGVMLTVGASGAVKCPRMSVRMLKPALAAALEAREISEIWTVYHSILYVLTKAGCTATRDPEPDMPQEKPNA